MQFSNHTGYPDWTGEIFSPAQISALLDGLEARGALGGCDAVISGYLGSVALGRVVLDAVRRVKAARPEALYLCDPVLGDSEAASTSARACRTSWPAAVPSAEVITPNLFELQA